METAELNEIKPALPYFLRHKTMWSNYDEDTDTLYLHFRKPNNADDSEITDDNVIIRYEAGEIIGITILNASKRNFYK
jgi:uncharacterized protein YuzE